MSHITGISIRHTLCMSHITGTSICLSSACHTSLAPAFVTPSAYLRHILIRSSLKCVKGRCSLKFQYTWDCMQTLYNSLLLAFFHCLLQSNIATYQVTVITSDVRGAGTDGEVYLSLKVGFQAE